MTTSDWLSSLAIIISFVSVLFIWGKYKLSKYDVWLKEINPTPNVLITNGEVKFRDYHDNIKDVDVKNKEFMILGFIANSGGGSANHPKWTWRLNLKDKKWAYGDIYHDVVIRNKTNSFQLHEGYYPYLQANSTPFPICLTGGYEFELKHIDERKKIKNLEIWIKYYGKKNTRWFSYRAFEFKNNMWVAKKPTKVYIKKAFQTKRKKRYRKKSRL